MRNIKKISFVPLLIALVLSITGGVSGKDRNKVEKVPLAGLKGNRHIVLALHFSDYDRQVSEGLEECVNLMVKPGDNLMVWTPVKLYCIPTGGDKKDLLERLQGIARRDSLVFKKNSTHAANSLEEIIRVFRRTVREDNKMPTATYANRTAAQFFLSNYCREIEYYKDRYITPNLFKLRQIAALLARGRGEKRIIAFQDREVYPHYVLYAKIADQINAVATGLMGNDMCNATRMFTVLNRVQKIMLLAEELPMKDIGETLKKAGVHYDVILFKGARKSTTIGDTVAPDLDKTFGYFALQTGGSAVITGNIGEGIKKIKKNTGAHADLSFSIHAQNNNRGSDLQENIRLENFSREGRLLKFSVTGVYRGLVKVSVRLLSQDDRVVYRGQRTLRCQKEKIDISMTLPSRYKGRHQLNIGALDLDTSRRAEFISVETL